MALEVLGIAGVQTVEEAFRTGGFGRWRSLKPATIRRKGSAAILIDSGLKLGHKRRWYQTGPN